LIAAFIGDPEKEAYWRAYRAGMLPEQRVQRLCNTYFCPSLTVGMRRGTSDFLSFHVIVVDDYGTKVKVGHPEEVLGTNPHYVIETSPGNYQAGWLMEPERDLTLVKGMLRKLRAAIGAGDNLTDPMAWRRLPVGVNGKAKYQRKDGAPWQIELASGGQP